MQAFLHGLVLAFGLILPLGVQNIFVFSQGALQPTVWQALPAVITASVCDTLLIVLSVKGVSVLLLTSSIFKGLLLLGGVLFLGFMGWLTWNSKPVTFYTQEIREFSARRQIAFAASVSLLNPHAILDTVGVIGTSSAGYAGVDKTLFTAACIAVSWVWFLFLAMAGCGLRSQTWFERRQELIQRLSAVFMWAAAFYMAWIAWTDYGQGAV